MAATVSSDQSKNMILSWMEHEDRCVTTQRVSQEMNVSRKRAADLLSETMKESSSKSKRYQVTVCQQSQTVENGLAVKVFRLRAGTHLEEDASTTIMALAPLQSTEAIATAHERDLLEWRERTLDGRHREAMLDTAIVPADAIASLKDKPPANQKHTVVEEEATAVASSLGGTNSRHKAFSGKKTVTTAASFFGSKKSSSSTSKSTTNTTTATATATTVGAPKPSVAKENKVRGNQVAPAPSTTKKMSSKKVGNADDFVADEEDSDDEQQIVTKKEKQAARRKAVKEANKEESSQLADTDDEAGETKEKYKVVGAMDAFATTAVAPKASAPATSGRQRKRRKKLVEETAMVNGYLRTETKAVWEDIPTDEEEEENRAAATKKQLQIKKASSGAQNPQGMKQKSLMGFFAKKK